MWHKYPNSKCAHVISIDTIDRTVDPVTGVIRTERLLGCKQKTPAWIVQVFFSRRSPCIHDLTFHYLRSSSAAQRMPLCGKSHSSTQQPKMSPSHLLISPFPNLPPASNKFGTLRCLHTKPSLYRRQKFKRAWQYGDRRRTALRSGSCNDSNKTRSWGK